MEEGRIFTRDDVLDAVRSAAADSLAPVDAGRYREWARDRPEVPGVLDVSDAFGSFEAALAAAGIAWDTDATPTTPQSLGGASEPPPTPPTGG